MARVVCNMRFPSDSILWSFRIYLIRYKTSKKLFKLHLLHQTTLTYILNHWRQIFEMGFILQQLHNAQIRYQILQKIILILHVNLRENCNKIFFTVKQLRNKCFQRLHSKRMHFWCLNLCKMKLKTLWS